MEWSRVKNILIVLLVIVNLFLFLVYLGTTVNSAKDNEELISHTVNVLSKNGIQVDGRAIPVNIPELYPATATLQSEVLGAPCDSGYFSFETKGDLESLTKRAGISILKKNDEEAMLEVNGIPVYNSIISYKNSVLSGFAVKEVNTLQGEQPYGICGLLVGAAEFLPKGKISAIIPGFFYNRISDSEIYLLPVWSVTIEGESRFINAMSGEMVEYLQK